MAASFCWMKLKDASVQPGGEVVNVVESAVDTQQVASRRSSAPGCSCAVTARAAGAQHESSGNCICCITSPLSFPKWGGRFDNTVSVGFSATVLTAPDADVWRVEGPSFKGPDGEPDNTMSCSQSFASREEAVNWLRAPGCDAQGQPMGQIWSDDAISLWLVAHIS